MATASERIEKIDKVERIDRDSYRRTTRNG